jgi:hypothetical protein
MIYASLDQVFVFDHPSQLVGPEGEGTCAVRQVTCWTDGRLNFKSAELAVLREVLEGVLDETQIHELASYAQDHPDCHLGEALRSLELKKAQLDAARAALTDESQCHSVWTIAEGRTRKWYRLCVRRASGTEGSLGPRWVYEW